jgi:hypothetical protein
MALITQVGSTNQGGPHNAFLSTFLLLVYFRSVWSPFSNTINLCPSINVRDNISRQSIRTNPTPCRRILNLRDIYFKGLFSPLGQHSDWTVLFSASCCVFNYNYIEIILSLATMLIPLEVDKELRVSINAINFRRYRSSSEVEFILFTQNTIPVIYMN